MEPQADAVRAPAQPFPGKQDDAGPEAADGNGLAADDEDGGANAGVHITVEALRHEAARRLAIPTGVPTIAEIAEAAERVHSLDEVQNWEQVRQAERTRPDEAAGPQTPDDVAERADAVEATTQADGAQSGEPAEQFEAVPSDELTEQPDAEADGNAALTEQDEISDGPAQADDVRSPDQPAQADDVRGPDQPQEADGTSPAQTVAVHSYSEPMAYEEPPDLLEAAEQLRAEVAGIHLPYEVDGAATAREVREALLGQLDDYLLPRLRRLDAPLLAVVGGSTGAGKSTLVNSIARREVTRSGVLRPTTRSPVLVHHPYDSGAFLSQRVLPGLARVTSEGPEPIQPIEIHAPRVTALRLVPHEGMTPGLAVIDAPDIDSVVETNRDLAVQLLASADLWVFVTTSARYGDAVPWTMLRQAVDRGVAVAVVLDRVPQDVMQEVRTDLATRLRDRGLGTSPMFTIPETSLHDGFLPEQLVAPLAGWLKRLALDARSRDVVVRRTLIGILDSLRERVHTVAAAAEAQDAAEAEVRAAVEAAYDEAVAALRRSLADGSVAHGEVLARWHDFVATGDVFRSLDTAGSWRDRVRALVRPRLAPAQPVLDALATGAESVVQARARAALDRLAGTLSTRISATSAGGALVTARRELTFPPAEFDERVARAVRESRFVCADLLRETEPTGSAAALGHDGALAALSLLAVQQPGTGAGGEAADLAEAVLEAIYGPQTVPPMVAAAREDLTRRLERLLEAERERVRGVIDALGLRPGRGAAVLARANVVEGAR